MLNELVLKNVKAATVALGLVKKGFAEPFVICGSGFLVDPKGYVMTAGHVSGKIKELIGAKHSIRTVAKMLDISTRTVRKYK